MGGDPGYAEPDRRSTIEAPNSKGRIMRYESTEDECAAIKSLLS
jgi:hypothetical protein